jgi:hypothetical protein
MSIKLPKITSIKFWVAATLLLSFVGMSSILAVGILFTDAKDEPVAVVTSTTPTPAATIDPAASPTPSVEATPEMTPTPSQATPATPTAKPAATPTPKPATPAPTPVPEACGAGGTCTSSDVAAHATAGDCWTIVAYSAEGGNGTGNVYKIMSSFFASSGTHDNFSSAPSLSASKVCGKNISSLFNSKHQGGALKDGGTTAISWLTANGNSFIGPWSGN